MVLCGDLGIFRIGRNGIGDILKRGCTNTAIFGKASQLTKSSLSKHHVPVLQTKSNVLGVGIDAHESAGPGVTIDDIVVHLIGGLVRRLAGFPLLLGSAVIHHALDQLPRLRAGLSMIFQFFQPWSNT